MKKNNLAAQGFEPGLFLVIKFCQKNGTFMDGPRATSGKVSLVQLAQIARNQKKEFTAADAQWGLSYSEIVFQLQLQQLC